MQSNTKFSYKKKATDFIFNQNLTALLIDRSIVSFGILFLRHSSNVARNTALYCGSTTLPFSKEKRQQ